MTALILFVAGAVLLAYVYLLYPLALTALVNQVPNRRADGELPRVTLIFCADNEGPVLPEKIANCKSLDYAAQPKVRSRWRSLLLYFGVSNLAALLGVANVLGRKRATTWQPGGTR